MNTALLFMMVFIVYIYIIMFCTGTSMNLVLITADLLHITIDLGLFQMDTDTEERVTETSMDDSEKHVIQLKSRSVLLSVTVFCFICVHMPVIRV